MLHSYKITGKEFSSSFLLPSLNWICNDFYQKKTNQTKTKQSKEKKKEEFVLWSNIKYTATLSQSNAP